MDVIEVEKLNQLISRADISGNDKVRWLTDFIDGREFEQQEISYSEEDLEYAFEQGKLNSNICYRRTFKNVLEILQFKKK